MSQLVIRTLDEAGFSPFLDQPRGTAWSDESQRLLAQGDLLLVGALADALRHRDCGPVVRIRCDDSRRETSVQHLSAASFLRETAMQRILMGGDVVVDVNVCGLVWAQLALAFGANVWRVSLKQLDMDLYGHREVGSKDATLILRERELGRLIEGGKRLPRVVVKRGETWVERDIDTETDVKRVFRAPGRELAQIRRQSPKAPPPEHHKPAGE